MKMEGTELAKGRKARRRIKSARITHVSLVRRGANRMPVLYKSGDRFQLQTVSKMGEDGLLKSLVFLPEETGFVDGEGDVMAGAALRQAAHGFLRDGGHIDVEHNLVPLTKEQAHIAEHFIVQPGDARFAGWTDYDGKPVNTDGAWALFTQITDPGLRDLFKSGEWNGVSMFGQALTEPIEKSDKGEPAAHDDAGDNDNDDMDPKQLKEMLDGLFAGLVKALKPEAPQAPTTPAQPAAIDFDPFDAEAVAKHADLAFFRTLDMAKPADVVKWQTHLAKKAKPAGAEPTELEKAQADLAAAQERITKLTKSTTVPASGGKPEPQVSPLANVSKSEGDEFAAGRAAMKSLQGSK